MSKLITMDEIAVLLHVSNKSALGICRKLKLEIYRAQNYQAGRPPNAVLRVHLDDIIKYHERTSIRSAINITHKMAVAALEEAKATGLSLPKIADEIGVHKSLLYHVLHDDKPMTIDTYEKLAMWQKERAENE